MRKRGGRMSLRFKRIIKRVFIPIFEMMATIAKNSVLLFIKVYIS